MPPLLQSCCCWRSLRTASFACAIYSMIYFMASSIIMVQFIYEEQMYLIGNHTLSDAVSFLEPASITYSTMIFSFAVLIIGILGVISATLLIIGISKDWKYLLLPWIVVMVADAIVELIHCGHLFIIETVEFNPVTAIIFTLDFFVVCLHIYSLLCVISLYQEYSSVRRTAEHERMINISGQGPSTESRIIINTPTVSSQKVNEPVHVHSYSTFDIDTPRASSMKRKGLKIYKGVSFAEDTIMGTAPY